MKAILKKIAGWKAFVPSNTRLVIAFHDIRSKSDFNFQNANSTEPKLFKIQIETIKTYFNLVTLDELLNSDSKSPLASITFDDGFSSIKNEVDYFLKKENIPYTIFVNGLAATTGFLEYEPEYASYKTSKNTEPLFLSPNEILDLHRSGVTIGSHSWSHRSLANCRGNELELQIKNNFDWILSLIGQPPLYFAFPFGKSRHISKDAIDLAHKTGHSRCFSAEPKYIKNLSDFLLPRLSVHTQTRNELKYHLNRMLIDPSRNIE